jgi:hypothetical protein
MTFLAIILLFCVPLSYADGNSFTVNVPNDEGGYTAIVITQSGDGYTGPQGEYYANFPSVPQLQTVYGLNAPGSAVVTNTYDEPAATITVTIAPPALPVYVQPDPPAPDYIWTPGYWAYDSFFEDYYWVPGTWVTAPEPGLLWTPGYWSWREGIFVYNDGYWGHHVGFYGGINYGHGYEGNGFSGGHWDNDVFVNKTINTNVSNVTNVTNVTNINNTTIINNTSSFNGGPGGTQAQPTVVEQAAMKEQHIPPTTVQIMHVHMAAQNPVLRASVNHGKPAVAATIKPGVFKGHGVVAAKAAGAFYSNTKPIKSGTSRISGGASASRHSEAIPMEHTTAEAVHVQTAHVEATPHGATHTAVSHEGASQEHKTPAHVQTKPKTKPKIKKSVPEKPKVNPDGTPIKNPQGS